jgi:hypothetical protein
MRSKICGEQGRLRAPHSPAGNSATLEIARIVTFDQIAFSATEFELLPTRNLFEPALRVSIEIDHAA